MAIITQIYDGFIGMKKKTTERTRQSVAAQKNAMRLLPTRTGEPRRYTTENHTGYFTECHENGIVNNQSLDGYIAMQTVIKHIASNGIAESVEEVGAHGDGCHIEPSLVVNEVGKLLERELLSALRLQTFLGKESASQCHHSCNNTEHGTYDSILMSGRTTYHFLEIKGKRAG